MIPASALFGASTSAHAGREYRRLWDGRLLELLREAVTPPGAWPVTFFVAAGSRSHDLMLGMPGALIVESSEDGELVRARFAEDRVPAVDAVVGGATSGAALDVAALYLEDHPPGPTAPRIIRPFAGVVVLDDADPAAIPPVAGGAGPYLLDDRTGPLPDRMLHARAGSRGSVLLISGPRVVDLGELR